MIKLKTIEQAENFSDKKFNKTFGVNKIVFATMISVFQRQYEKSHKKGGRPPKVSIFERLCIFFAYYRDGRTIADIANEYSIAESTTFDIIRLVEEALLLDERFHLPSKRTLLKEDIDIAIVDATECSIQRPKKQRNYYSGKKKRHTLLVISDDRIFCTNYAVHDFQLFKLSQLPLRQNTLVIADTGYLGIEKIHRKTLIPKKTSKLHRLTLEDKYYNRVISKCRICIEHVIRKIKCFRIFSERYRSRHNTFKKRFNLVCAIFNFSLQI